MAFQIKEDDLSGSEIRELIHQHRKDIASRSPPESFHALAIELLQQADITVWSAWESGQLLGCGALKELSPQHGEIKSMRTASAHQQRGVGAAILQHIIQVAQHRGYQKLSLETGKGEEFAAAHRLYHRFGFVECGPFAEYVQDTFSTFMCLTLEFDPGVSSCL